MTFPLHKYLAQLQKEKFSEAYKKTISDYVIKLGANELPIIFSTKHFSSILGLEYGYLKSILNNIENYYSGFKIRKKNGGTRWILAPKPELKSIQKWIETYILNKLTFHDNANGFIKGRSIISNASIHLNKEVILNVDLYKFFDCVSSKRVYGVFKSLGYLENLAKDFATLLCAPQKQEYIDEILTEGIITEAFWNGSDGILPQGSPASPAITNFICRTLDIKFSKLSEKLGCSYSRYADDLTFSGSRKSIPSITTIKNIISEQGFVINESKICYQSKKRRQLVTGVVVNNDLRVRREIKDEVKRHLYYCKQFGVKSHLDFLEEKDGFKKGNYKDWLIGKIFFIYSVEPKLGEFLLKEYQSIEWYL